MPTVGLVVNRDIGADRSMPDAKTGEAVVDS